MKSSRALPATMVFAAVVTSSAFAAPIPCERLASLHLPDTTITVAAVVPAGIFTPPGATAPIDTAACRVAGIIKPTSDSSIAFEVWMPTSNWNGKFLSAGEGGYAGEINYGGIADALRRGYAGGSTDTGHAGGTLPDFAPGHPQQVIDFGWRAKHLQAARSKDVIRSHFGRPAEHSYFSSCSTGGRQALMEIQRFAADYDGVIVGAPGNDFTHQKAGYVWNEQALFSTPGAHVRVSKLAAVQAATLASCDWRDGVLDGVAQDPRRCQFDPTSLACSEGTDGPSCLTPPQVIAVSKIMAGPKNPRTGRQIFPGYFTSAAGELGAWPLWITGFITRLKTPDPSVQAIFGNAFFARVVHEIPAPDVWDYSTFDFDGDMIAADRKAAFDFNANEEDLFAFRHFNRRGKIIMWHGWEDPAISALNTVNYYERVLRHNDDARDFFRLFMVPGMLHCGGGPGPNAFGQNLPQTTGLSRSPRHDILTALERWVEQGVPPERIDAVKYANDQPSQGVLRTRPLCAYPKAAEYDGSGSTDEAANFRCKQNHHENRGHGDDDRDE